MGDREESAALVKLAGRRLTRRAALRFGMLAAALPLAAACGGQQAAPAPKTEAKPTEAAKPAAPAAATAAPKTEAKPTEAAKPAAQAPAVAKAKINGKLTVIQALDFHPDHNALVEAKIKEFAEKQSYPLDHSYISAFAGTGNPVQKLQAAVEAGDPPDIVCHNGMQPAELQGLEIIEDTDALVKDLIKEYGSPPPSFAKRIQLDGLWWGAPHFSRAGGFWAVEGPFKEAGIDIRRDLDDFDKVRDAALKVSKPEREVWGWGLTGNRSGDGNTTVRGTVTSWGGQLPDETGQLVVIGKDPYRQYTIAALEWLKEIYTDQKWTRMVPPGVNSWTDPTNNEAYLGGKIVFTNNGGTMFAKAVVDKNPVADDTWLLQQPKGMGPGGRVVTGAGEPMTWFIMKGAKNREAADQLIKYMLTPDVQRQMWRISPGYVYPAYEWGWDDPVLKESTYAQHVTDTWKAITAHPSAYTHGGWPGPPTAWTASLDSSNFWTDMFGEVLGGKAVPDVVRDAHARAVRVFKEFGAKGE